MDKYSKLISVLFNARDVVHLVHLRVTGEGSYAQHMALNDLYSALEGDADDVCELIQGYEGILDITIPMAAPKPIIPFLEDLRSNLIKAQADLDSMPDVQNKLQETIGSISKTLYKLKNLE